MVDDRRTGRRANRRTDEPTDERGVLGMDGGASGVEIAERQTLEAVLSVCLAADKAESPQGTGAEGGGRVVGFCLTPHKACSRTHISESRFLWLRWVIFFSLSSSLTWECLDRFSSRLLAN